VYGPQAVDEVRFIRRAQALGFSLPEIAGLLALSRTGVAPCDQVVRLGREHLAALDAKLERLTRFRSQLRAAVASWSDGGCGFTSKGLSTLIELADVSEPSDAR
jgi:MerR family mercuric resistance operon transcriptional regulator